MPASTDRSAPTAAREDWFLLTFDEETDQDVTIKPTTREDGLLALLRFPSGGTGETCFDEWLLREHEDTEAVSVEHDRGARGQVWFACLAQTEEEARDRLMTYLS